MGIRVIGGKLRGKKLKTLAGEATRPTADKVRESIFNILFGKVENAHVLDLFAGAGAFGIESLSRGAVDCTFIDINPKAIDIINQNINACRFSALCQVIKWDLSKNIGCLADRSGKFDLIFMDPPYHKNMIEKTLLHIDKYNILDPGALIVAEHAQMDRISEKTGRFVMYDQRRYGKTLVSFFNFML